MGLYTCECSCYREYEVKASNEEEATQLAGEKLAEEMRLGSIECECECVPIDEGVRA
jgi:hypothetical protein